MSTPASVTHTQTHTDTKATHMCLRGGLAKETMQGLRARRTGEARFKEAVH